MVDLDFGGHIDAARWLVQNEHLGLNQQPLGQHDFLLVAAA